MRNQRSSIVAVVLFVVMVLGVACGGPSYRGLVDATRGTRIAVVSLAINDLGGALQGWNATRTSDLMYTRAATMVQMAEQRLAQSWEVVPVSAFAGNPTLQQMATVHEVAIPYINSVPLPTLAPDRRSLVGARLNPAQTAALAQVTGASLFVTIYAEWGVRTGGFVPTSKALAKTVVGIFDVQGQEVYHGRADTIGERTLGAFGAVVVDENTIDEWVNAYGAGLDRLFR